MVPYADLKAQYEQLEPELTPALARVLASTQFVLGPEVEAFEREFAASCGARHAVAVNSGTSALHLALLAAGIGPGDEVITVAFTFVATVAAVRWVGATPVLVDIDPVTFNIDPARLEAALTPRTRAVMPVHLYGQPADMDAVASFARRHDLLVIEDAAQAHGALHRGRRVGSLGELACFSFYPGKNLGAYGEAGAVTTHSAERAEALRRLRNWGEDESGRYALAGFNYRMDALQAAVLRVKLHHLETWNARRRELAELYRRELADAALVTPAEAVGGRHVYHVFAVRVPERDAVRAALTERGIGTRVHYPLPVHLQPSYADLGLRPGALPESERAAREVLSLPIHPELREEQVLEVCDALREGLEQQTPRPRSAQA